MNIKTRRFIMFSFIIAFFVLAPIIIFYASGYRYDLKRFKIIKTGTIMLEAKSIKDAEIFIDNKLYEKPLDEKIFIYNLLPGEYNIKLAKDGYHPWEKKITIYSSLTTFAKDIVLFKKEVPLQIVEGKLTDFSLSPDSQNIVYLTMNETLYQAWLYNLETKDKNLIYQTKDLVDQPLINWAASGKKILLNLNDQYIIYDAQNLKLINLPTIAETEITNLQWDISSDSLLYSQNTNSIWQIDLIGQNSKAIFSETNDIRPEFFIEASDIYYIAEEAGQNILYKHNLTFNTKKKILEINRSKAYSFLASSNNYLTLIDNDLNKLYLIKKALANNMTEAETIKEFKAKKASWDKNEEQLLIYDDFELQTYWPETNTTTTINRYGQEILKAEWYPNLPYIIIIFKDKIEIIDLLLTKEVRNINEIVNFDQLDDFSLDRKGQKIFFNGAIGKQQGLYELKIKD